MHRKLMSLLLSAAIGLGGFTADIASKPDVLAKTTSEAPSYDSVDDFVIRLYVTCLGRFPEDQGLTDWASALRSGRITGAAAARGFFFSDELTSGNVSDEEFVTKLYNALMDREPDEDGFADWVGRLSNGASRYSVFTGFANSSEYAALCASYGIESGSVSAAASASSQQASEAPARQTVSTAQNDGPDLYTEYARRLYTTILGRDGSDEEYANWGARIRSGEISFATAARGFFISQEFRARNLDDEQFVRVLYRTYLDRDPDETGLADWMQKLSSGMSRDSMTGIFANSAEFRQLTRTYTEREPSPALTRRNENYERARSILNETGWDLRAAYDWCVSMSYVRSGLDESQGTDSLAEIAYTTKSGNCYCYAAAFTLLARELGYTVYQISGWVPSRRGGVTIHSWTEIQIDGIMYVCDPEFEHATGYDGYMFHYGRSGTWRYTDYHRMPVLG